MRDTNIKNKQSNQTDKEVFNEFTTQLQPLMEKAGKPLKYSFYNHIGIPYKDGFLEIYDYDRPVNPRLEQNRLVFDYHIAGERHEIQITLV